MGLVETYSTGCMASKLRWFCWKKTWSWLRTCRYKLN
jgi:hypothetical protein